MTRRLLDLLLLGLLAFSAACASTTTVPTTEVLVVVNSDLKLGVQLTRLQVSVQTEDGAQTVATPFPIALTPDADAGVGKSALPLSFAITKPRDGTPSFRVLVAGYGPLGLGGSETLVIEQKAIASFQDQRSLRLHVFLGSVCFQKGCGAAAGADLVCYPTSMASTPAGACGPVTSPALEQVEPTRELVGIAPGSSEALAVDAAVESSNSGVGGRDGSVPGVEPDASKLGLDAGLPAPAPALLANDGKPALSLGVSHACVRLAEGGVRCWGENTDGQLGNGSTIHSSRPVAVSGLSDVAEVRAGGSHTCARTTSGQVMCWGANGAAQTGAAASTKVSFPSTVRSVSGATSISTGRRHSCALVGSKDAYCWGDPNYEALGGNRTMFAMSTPALVADSSPMKTALASTPAGFHSCLLNATSVICWGENLKGQLGAGEDFVRWPQVVPGLEGSQALALGGMHTCALAQGTVKCLGDNDFGQLGDGTNTEARTPVSVPGLENIHAIASGFFHTCALHEDGGVSCWGFGFVPGGQNGINTPTRVPNVDGVREISAGYDFTCAVKREGNVLCWGGNEKGQLGNGTFDQALAPTPVVGL